MGCVFMKPKAIEDNDDNTQDETLADIASNTAPLTPTINIFQMSLFPKQNLHRFSFEELSRATKNFSTNNFLGNGGHGNVFKGFLIEKASAERITVAVKTLYHNGLQGHKEWLDKVYFLGNLYHPNIVKLLGYCIDADQRMLVYEYMPRGSLKNHLLRRSESLSWSIRMKVALDAAKALAYLHEEAEKQVIYRDLKTSNILLDTDFTAKLSDFGGLSRDVRVGDMTDVFTEVMGTYGYVAPEYLYTGHPTIKCDVYSFGIVLLEIISGCPYIDKKRKNHELNIVDWARPYLGDHRRFVELIDPQLQGQFSLKAAHSAVRLVADCISHNPVNRPVMSEVVKILEPLFSCDDVAVSSPTYGPMFGESSRSNWNIYQ